MSDPVVTRIHFCRECGDELDEREVDVTGLCEACWEDRIQYTYDPPDIEDDVLDPLALRDDEMGM